MSLYTQTRDSNTTVTPADPQTEYLGFSVEIRPRAESKLSHIRSNLTTTNVASFA